MTDRKIGFATAGYGYAGKRHAEMLACNVASAKGPDAGYYYVIEHIADILKGRTALNANKSEGLKMAGMIGRICQGKLMNGACPLNA